MITQQELKEHVTYNKVTGEFLNKKTGRIATTKEKTKSGVRLRIYIKGVGYYASRMAVLYVTGKYPDGFVRCINGDSSDLRWKNLQFQEQEFIGERREEVPYDVFCDNDKAVKEVIELPLLKRIWRYFNG